MEIKSSYLHIGLVRNCIPLIEKKTGARICCPVNGSLVLVRGSLEATHFASEMIAVMLITFLNSKIYIVHPVNYYNYFSRA
jgi:hypothetical protein